MTSDGWPPSTTNFSPPARDSSSDTGTVAYAASSAPSDLSSDLGGDSGTVAMGTTTDTGEGETRLAVAEEQLRVGKREVSRGGVRVRSVVTEKPVETQVSLRDEITKVERRPVGCGAVDADTNVFNEQAFELTETDEEAVVAKETRVIEEVVIGKTTEQRTETVRDTA